MAGTERARMEQQDHLSSRAETDRPFGDLFRDLYQNSYRLLTREIDLAKLEISGKASQAVEDSMYVVFGVLIAFAGFLLLLAAATVSLSQYLPLSLAALTIGAPVTIIGFILMRAGRKRLRKESPVSEKTLETLRDPGTTAGVN